MPIGIAMKVWLGLTVRGPALAERVVERRCDYR
jgi:hypothetical protein